MKIIEIINQGVGNIVGGAIDTIVGQEGWTNEVNRTIEVSLDTVISTIRFLNFATILRSGLEGILVFMFL